MNRNKIEELFNYAIQDPKKWSYGNVNNHINYKFSDYRFTYTDVDELRFYDDADDGDYKTIYSRHPCTAYPFIKRYWTDTMLIVAYTFTWLITYLILTLLILIGVSIVELFGVELLYGGVIFLYSAIVYSILYTSYTIWFYISNKESIKHLKILDIMRNSNTKKVYEDKIDKENKDFNKLVENHFKRQSRKTKLKHIISDI